MQHFNTYIVLRVNTFAVPFNTALYTSFKYNKIYVELSHSQLFKLINASPILVMLLSTFLFFFNWSYPAILLTLSTVLRKYSCVPTYRAVLLVNLLIFIVNLILTCSVLQIVCVTIFLCDRAWKLCKYRETCVVQNDRISSVIISTTHYWHMSVVLSTSVFTTTNAPSSVRNAFHNDSCTGNRTQIANLFFFRFSFSFLVVRFVSHNVFVSKFLLIRNIRNLY